jgi:hypothetical protein
MILAQRSYPFTKGLASMRRRAWKPCEKWSEPQDRTKAGDIDLSDERIPAELRLKVIAARMYGGEFARSVGDEIDDALDDGRIDPAIAAALLRALGPREDMNGDYQAGTGDGGDAGHATGDAWARPLGDPWAGGKGPIKPPYAPPSSDPGYLLPIDAKRRMASGLMKRGRLTRLERKCELIAAGPFNAKPNMKAIEAQVEREFKQGLLAA